MGRHYDGDISGKFWFGVQDSGDAEHFGAYEIEHELTRDIDTTQTEDEDGNIIYEHEEEYHSGFIDYCIDFDRIDVVKEGIQLCKKQLANNYKIISNFFEDVGNNGYNDEMIIKYYKDKHSLVINEDFLRDQMQIYARLQLGTQILVYFNENPGEDCHFTAEM
jgi:hypothetical protein